MAAVGRPGRVEDLPENLRAREVPSTRHPVADFAFRGGWKQKVRGCEGAKVRRCGVRQSEVRSRRGKRVQPDGLLVLGPMVTRCVLSDSRPRRTSGHPRTFAASHPPSRPCRFGATGSSHPPPSDPRTFGLSWHSRTFTPSHPPSRPFRFGGTSLRTPHLRTFAPSHRYSSA